MEEGDTVPASMDCGTTGGRTAHLCEAVCELYLFSWARNDWKIFDRKLLVTKLGPRDKSITA